MIKLQNISKYYTLGEELFFALDHVSLNIKENDFVAIVGASGSGKSTLMNIIGCLDQPSAGEYWLSGEKVEDRTEAQLAAIRNKKIGFIFQSFNLLPKLSVLDNVIRPLIYQGLDRVERRERAIAILTELGLKSKLAQRPNELSGGQRQRVAVARALVTQPKILLADEPTGNLDSKTTEEIMYLFEQLHKKGQTIIIVTHEDYVASRCHRQIHMSDGVITQDCDLRAEV